MTWKMPFHLTSFFPLCRCCVLDKKVRENPQFESHREYRAVNFIQFLLDTEMNNGTEQWNWTICAWLKLRDWHLQKTQDPNTACLFLLCVSLSTSDLSSLQAKVCLSWGSLGSYMGFSILFKVTVSKPFENKQWFMYFHNTFRGKEAQWSLPNSKAQL